MKEYIEYMYNLTDIRLIKDNNKIFIYNKKDKYNFIRIQNKERLYESYYILNNNTEYDKIIKNRNADLVSVYNNYEYVLIKKCNKGSVKSNEIVIPIDKAQNMKINQSNWSYLWEKKIDFYEKHNTIHKQLEESKDYFIGITEMLIQYMRINNIYTEILYVCKNKIEEEQSPLNIVLDCKERELAEKIKYDYFYKDQKIEDLTRIPPGINLKKLIIRLLFPNYFFDIYDEFMRGEENIKKLKIILSKTKDYELYIKEIIKKTSFH